MRLRAQVEEQVPLAAAEVYLFTWRQHLCFLPGLPWLPLGWWHLPEKQMAALATSVRKVARLLWALHLSFLDGFDEVLPACDFDFPCICRAGSLIARILDPFFPFAQHNMVGA
jgi:hypothetical protein